MSLSQELPFPMHELLTRKFPASAALVIARLARTEKQMTCLRIVAPMVWQSNSEQTEFFTIGIARAHLNGGLASLVHNIGLHLATDETRNRAKRAEAHLVPGAGHTERRLVTPRGYSSVQFATVSRRRTFHSRPDADSVDLVHYISPEIAAGHRYQSRSTKTWFRRYECTEVLELPTHRQHR